MQAVIVHRFADLDSVFLEERADPAVGPLDVLVEVRAVPVNFVDLVTMRGEYQFSPLLPYVPGKGPTGVVRATGAEVTGFAPGDRVLAMAEHGGYAELVGVNMGSVYHLPNVLSFEDAASMSLAYDTAWVALRERARMVEGESVLILGASGAVGHGCVQLARAFGASLVLSGVSRPDRFEGPAEEVIDLSIGDPREAIRDQVRERTGGAGVDIVIDLLGGDAFEGGVRSLAWRGRLVIVGFASGRIASLKTNYVLLKNIEVSGVQVSDYRKRMPTLVAEAFKEIFQLVVDGRIMPPAADLYPLSQWREALERVLSRTAKGRVLLAP